MKNEYQAKNFKKVRSTLKKIIKLNCKIDRLQYKGT